jgi:hypothetical protein
MSDITSVLGAAGVVNVAVVDARELVVGIEVDCVVTGVDVDVIDTCDVADVTREVLPGTDVVLG